MVSAFTLVPSEHMTRSCFVWASLKDLQRSIFKAGLFLFLCAGPAFLATAQTTYELSCPESTIKASIPYNMIGKYKAVFSSCQGRIVYDNESKQVISVDIKIDATSIRSNCAWCDRIVKSRRILETAKYPELIFKSDSFTLKKDGYWVKGLLTVHGKTQPLESAFEVIEADDRWLIISGTWQIRRKRYGIIWSKVLDHGGIVVGDVVTVNWRVRAKRTIMDG